MKANSTFMPVFALVSIKATPYSCSQKHQGKWNLKHNNFITSKAKLNSYAPSISLSFKDSPFTPRFIQPVTDWIR